MQTITPVTPTCIKGEDLQEWLQVALKEVLPEKLPYIINRPQDAKGGSKFFSAIDVDEAISVEELLTREVSEHSRGDYIHFYADDVVAAACGAGVLSGTWFWLYYTW